ncbi:MAG TPA: type II toxin-antitoxin system HicB family antitoxin [Hyphomicrobiaceae bacterium]|nr:type II toxin-antitoxin system HicB family antitoxin [Hyphomicrobiaceae bacterium]
MAYYVGIVDGSGDTWGVRIPDFPGCHGGGATPEAAVADATRALREFAAQMVAEEEPIPEPRSISQILDDLAASGEPSGATVFIPLLLDKARPVRANISLDAGLLEAIDAEAERRGLTRSAFLASAAIDKIADAR